MENGKTYEKQTPEEIARAAQEAAIKSAMEQAQLMLGNIPGMNMQDMQAQIMAQMQAAVPNLVDIQTQQATMGTLGDVDADTVCNTGMKNMNDAADITQSLMNLDFNADDFFDDNDSWEIKRSKDGTLNSEQLRLLALGAPILVYNDEYTDTIGHQEYVDSLKEQIRSWREVTDRESAFEIVDWLLREGHHAEADRVLAAMRNGQETEGIDEDKVEDVSLITDYMLENSICDMNSVPHTAIAWDLVRIVNLGRWAFQCGYITEEDMWNIMCVADETASANFSSWEEYGMSFVLGRGVWHGDTDDCQTAYEIVAELLKNEDSPWLQLSWSD